MAWSNYRWHRQRPLQDNRQPVTENVNEPKFLFMFRPAKVCMCGCPLQVAMYVFSLWMLMDTLINLMKMFATPLFYTTVYYVAVSCFKGIGCYATFRAAADLKTSYVPITMAYWIMIFIEMGIYLGILIAAVVLINNGDYRMINIPQNVDTSEFADISPRVVPIILFIVTTVMLIFILWAIYITWSFKYRCNQDIGLVSCGIESRSINHLSTNMSGPQQTNWGEGVIGTNRLSGEFQGKNTLDTTTNSSVGEDRTIGRPLHTVVAGRAIIQQDPQV